jgi:hypothetical protein
MNTPCFDIEALLQRQRSALIVLLEEQASLALEVDKLLSSQRALTATLTEELRGIHNATLLPVVSVALEEIREKSLAMMRLISGGQS